MIADKCSFVTKYPSPKEVMLGAVYDALDVLELPVQSSNRERGTIVIKPTNDTENIRIAVNEKKGETEIAVIPEGDMTEDLCNAILDEISAAYMKGREN